MQESEESGKYRVLSQRTKWIIALFLGLLVILLEFVLYHMAYRIGFDEGCQYTPPAIIQQSDEKALACLSQFMADVFSSRDRLADVLDDREARLSWIRDPKTKVETIWGLARELMERGGESRALPIIRELAASGKDDGDGLVWAARMEEVGKHMMESRYYPEAYECFSYSATIYEAEKKYEALVPVLQTMCSISQTLNRKDLADADLKRAIDACSYLGDSGKKLKAGLLARRGRMAKSQGHNKEALNFFRQAMEMYPSGEYSDPEGSLLIGMGEALLETGKKNEAAVLLKKGLLQAENGAVSLNDRLDAMRSIARILSENNEFEQALSYLHQAEGAAKGILPDSHMFWPGLYDQRGWVNMMRDSISEARDDFDKALKQAKGMPMISVQSLEGMGRVMLDEGKGASAIEHLKQAAQLRSAYYPEDQFSLGRVHYYLGQAYDLSGDGKSSLESYAQAVNFLKQCERTENENKLLIESYQCMAYALCEIGRWNEAAIAFEAVLPLLHGEREVEVLSNLGRCYDKLGQPAKADVYWQKSGLPRTK